MAKQRQSQTLLDALDLSGLEPDDQEDIMLTVNDLVFRGALVRLLERMDGTERERFSAMMAGAPTEEEVMSFLRTVKGSEDVVKETVDELRDDILAVTKPK